MEIPYTSGVYFFKRADGTVVYIGKAKNLRNRLRHHPMLARADKLEWQETNSEIEALILEARFIKKYKPKYNISLRDDKNYVYVTFTDEEFLKVFIGHRSGIGPFTSSTELRAALRALRKIFPYCTCKQAHLRTCLNAHIGLCFGFCCLKTTATPSEKAMYRASVRALRDVLSGRRRSILNHRMIENTKVIREIAGREQALAQLMKLAKLTKFPARIECYDISNIQGRFATGSMVVFENGYPNTSEYRKFKIRAPASPDDTKMLDEMLSRRFTHRDWPRPDLVLIDGGKGQINVAKKYFQPVISIAKGKEEIFSSALDPLPLATMDSGVRHLILHLDAEAHRFAITYYRKLHRRTVSGKISAP